MERAVAACVSATLAFPAAPKIWSRAGLDAAAGAAAKNQTVVVDLIGELAIQKAPPGYRGV